MKYLSLPLFIVAALCNKISNSDGKSVNDLIQKGDHYVSLIKKLLASNDFDSGITASNRNKSKNGNN